MEPSTGDTTTMGMENSDEVGMRWELGLGQLGGAVFLILYSVGVICFASYRSLTAARWLKQQQPSMADEDLTIKTSMAIAFPIAASLALVIFYYFFSIVSLIVVVCSVIVSLSSIGFCTLPAVEWLVTSLCIPSTSTSATSNSPELQRRRGLVAYPLCTLIGLLVIWVWLTTGNEWASNLIATSICVLFISFIRMPSIKVAAALLSALFVYDFFWVFCSEYFFGQNVMVTVAMRQAENPAVMVAQSLSVEVDWVKKVELPMKLIVGGHVLGLGDIALPGIFLAFALKFDALKTGGRMCWRGYFRTGVIGYTLGLFMAFFAVIFFHVAQPALIYLVPGSVLPVVFSAARAGELGLLWHGPPGLGSLGTGDDIKDKNEDPEQMV